MKTNHPSVKEILKKLVEDIDEDPLFMTSEAYLIEATQALEARFRVMMEEMVGEDEATTFYSLRQGRHVPILDKDIPLRNQARAEQRQRIDQVIKENFGGRDEN